MRERLSLYKMTEDLKATYSFYKVMKNVLCSDCGKEISTLETKFITIPKYRCDPCLKKRVPSSFSL